MADELALGTECELGGVDGVCSLAQCDGSGSCGVYLKGATLSDTLGQFHDAVPFHVIFNKAAVIDAKILKIKHPLE